MQKLQVQTPSAPETAEIPSLLTDQQLQSLLQQAIGQIITIFSKQCYRIQPIRQTLIHKIHSICQSKLLQHPSFSNRDSYIINLVDRVSIFLWVLSRASGVWITMLNDEKLISESTELDLYLFTSKVYKKLLSEGSMYLPEFGKYCDLVTKAIIHYLEFISNEITGVYNVNKKLVVEEIDELNTDTQEMKLLNKFMVFKLLKELNEELREKIHKNIQNSVFCYVDPEQMDAFVNYIIDKHDVISFVYAKNKPNPQHTPETGIPLEDQFVEKILMLGSNMKKVHYRHAIREDGKKAVFLEIQKGIEEQENIESYLITVDDDDDDELLVYNPAFTRKKWAIEDRVNEDQSIDELIKSKQGMIKSMRGAPNEVKTMPKNAHTIGGSLGNCLADLNKYDSFQSFLTDFSKKAVISTSLNFVVSNIPLIGYILVTGGFSLTFYNLLKNDFKNDQRKIEDLGAMILGSTTSIGTGFIGGLIGSAFIPIPILGFFLGGLVGGFVGGVTSNAIEKALSSAKFLQTIDILQSTINKSGLQIGSWDVNKKIIKKLGTTLDYFLANIPENLQTRVGCDRHWLALIGFSILTFHETNMDMKKNEKRVKELEGGKETEMVEIRVSPYLEMSLGYLEKTRIDLRANVRYLEMFFKQMFSGA